MLFGWDFHPRPLPSYKNPIGETPTLFGSMPNMKSRDSWVDCDGQMNPENRKILPRLVFTRYASRFKELTLNEGFLIPITKIEFEVRMQLPASLMAVADFFQPTYAVGRQWNGTKSLGQLLVLTLCHCVQAFSYLSLLVPMATRMCSTFAYTNWSFFLH